MKPQNVLILPGWENSGPQHWQSLWEQKHGYARVEQHDWMKPLRGDWITRLEDVLLARSSPSVLVAHSLGCQLVSAWAQVSRNTHLVQAALLVAPGDVEREEIRPHLPSWVPVVLDQLPFTSRLIACHNDPYCAFERAQFFARHWGAEFEDFGQRGHINADSGLGDWDDGHQRLLDLIAAIGTSTDKHESREGND